MSSERKRQATTTQLRAVQRWLAVEGHAVHALDVRTGVVTPEQLFGVLILWKALETGGGWMGWLTTMNHRSTCFGAADLDDASFGQWLAVLPGWEPARLARALEIPGLHLVWRRHVD